MICIRTYGIDNTHGIDLNWWYSIHTSESHTYKRAECCPYAGLFGTKTVFFSRNRVICSYMLAFYRFLSPFRVHLLKSPCFFTLAILLRIYRYQFLFNFSFSWIEIWKFLHYGSDFRVSKGQQFYPSSYAGYGWCKEVGKIYPYLSSHRHKTLREKQNK